RIQARAQNLLLPRPHGRTGLPLIRTKAAIGVVRARPISSDSAIHHNRLTLSRGWPRRPDRESFGMTARIRDFLRKRTDEGPCLVVDLDVVRDNYQAFAKALPDTRVFYAVKANPAPEVLSLLASLGSCFDAASVPEIEMALAAG